MSQKKNNTKEKKKQYGHLCFKERELLEEWLKEDVSKAEIARRLRRDRSTIWREIKRGTTTQRKQVNGYEQERSIYYSDSGQINYEKNRQKSKPRGIDAFSTAFVDALEEAHQQHALKGKGHWHNIQTFITVYTREHPNEQVPTFKTVYTYIREGLLSIKPHNLPLMYRLGPRKNKSSKPKGTNKKTLGISISERPESVLTREEFDHWEADLVKGKRTKNEPAIITLVERKTRYALTKKIDDYKSQTVKDAFDDLLSQSTSLFQSITFDNGAEFSSMSELPTSVYFCHAYSAWERGSNENFNKLLREWIPKGISLHQFTEEYINRATESLNQRYRAVIDFRTAHDYFGACTG